MRPRPPLRGLAGACPSSLDPLRDPLGDRDDGRGSCSPAGSSASPTRPRRRARRARSRGRACRRPPRSRTCRRGGRSRARSPRTCASASTSAPGSESRSPMYAPRGSRPHEPRRLLDALDQRVEVARVGEEAVLDRQRLARIAGVQPNRAPRARLHQEHGRADVPPGLERREEEDVAAAGAPSPAP